jgi:hypothetical protein
VLVRALLGCSPGAPIGAEGIRELLPARREAPVFPAALGMKRANLYVWFKRTGSDVQELRREE